jgi:hypothetical protein
LAANHTRHDPEERLMELSATVENGNFSLLLHVYLFSLPSLPPSLPSSLPLLVDHVYLKTKQAKLNTVRSKLSLNEVN